jgi:feruloyl-CoA synthase
MTARPHRPVRLGPHDATVREAPGGVRYVASPHPLGPYPASVTERLEHWAQVAPQRTFLAARAGDGWERLDYATAFARVERLAQALVERGLSVERPVAILSENSIDHALLGLAAMHAGIPYVPVSPAYSLVSTDFSKLKLVCGIARPGLLYAADGERFGRALAAVAGDAEVVVSRAVPAGATPFDALLAGEATGAVASAHAAVGPDTIAKILFTSGSTGVPKGVVNTQRMLCSNQQMLTQTLSFIEDEPPVVVDWLPWNHTFGGNHNFGLVLFNGGTLYIDDGRPLPGAPSARTVENLRGLSPTLYFNVPKGFEMLVPFLREDGALRATFFANLKMIFYAGAALAPAVWQALVELGEATCGERIFMATSLGSTETAPLSLATNFPVDRPGIIGVPTPGVEVKLVPREGKLELRVRGPNVMPAYYRQPEETRAAFDEEGFYRTGDALRFVDSGDASRGFLFDGRIAEDFKLATGTWVNAGPMRIAALAHLAPFARDAVLAGHDRDSVGLLVFPDLEACRALCGPEGAGLAPGTLLAHPRVRARFAELLASLARESTGSSTRIERLILLEEPPSLDASEITDKGSLNARAILERRAALVSELFNDTSTQTILPALERT